MEDTKQIIDHLKNEIKARDRDIHLAATYGKQLFEEKASLQSKYEELNIQTELLEQDKHSLQFELETKIQIVNSLTNEIEIQSYRADNLFEKLQISEQENEAMHKKIQNLQKENHYLKQVQEDLNVANKSLNDKIILQDKLIKNFEDVVENSICESEKEDNCDIQAQLNTYVLNNKELQDALYETQQELEEAKKNENLLLKMIADLEEVVSDRDSEIATNIAEINKAKEDIGELQCEIEFLKYDQVDTNRRGNSVFAELDDRRNMVEREYKKLQKKYEHFKKEYDVNKTELDRARGQMAILQSMVSREYQQSYIDRLEDSLSCAKKEILDLTHKLSKASKSNGEVEIKNIKFSNKNEYDYLRVMLQQSQKKEKELHNEIMTLRMKNIHDSDKLSETHQLLYQAKEDLDLAKQEINKLKVKIKDAEQGIQKSDFASETHKPKIEVFENCETQSVRKKANKTNVTDISILPDKSMIPGELELDFDDGFRQIKPPRKSNKFILQEFNCIEGGEQNAKKSLNQLEKNELVKNTKKLMEVGNENERTQLKHRNYSKVTTSKRNDNCAQQ